MKKTLHAFLTVVFLLTTNGLGEAQWKSLDPWWEGWYLMDGMCSRGDSLFFGTFGNGLHLNIGDIWSPKRITPDSIAFINSVEVNSTYVFVATDHYLFRSRLDDLVKWEKIESGFPQGTESYRIRTTLFCSDSLLLVGTYYGLFKSINNGLEWTMVTQIDSNEVVGPIAADSDGSFCVGTRNGIFLSENGKEYVRVNKGLVDLDISAITVFNGYFFAGTQNTYVNSGKMYVFDGVGRQWNLVNDGLLGGTIYDFVDVQGNLFVATWSGIFKFTGGTWRAINEGLEISGRRVGVVDLAVIGKYLYAGSGGYGVWRRPLREVIGDPTSVDERQESFPTSYKLSQNFPNPFNPTTTIGFQLPVNSDVTLSIFNTNGQLVKKLVAAEMNAGRHNLTWDATNERGERVASGVYLYVIKAGDFTAQKKLLLMK